MNTVTIKVFSSSCNKSEHQFNKKNIILLSLIFVELKGGIKTCHASSDRMAFFIVCLVFAPEADIGACDCLKTIFFTSCWKSNLDRQERRKAISVKSSMCEVLVDQKKKKKKV